MTSWRRTSLFGILVWLVPFLVAFFPLKESWRSLFESVMPVALALVVVACAVRYFRRVSSISAAEGAGLGLLWLALSVLIGLPLMLSPPTSYTVEEYAADVGLTYLMIPIITIGMAVVASRNGEKDKP